jgi:glycosyltransferase involved in cell wall biosynthesis
MKNKSRKILILIPAYNAAGTLPELIARIRKAAADVDIIVINDGSTDNTAAVLSGLKVRFLDNEHNCGKGYALQRGYSYGITNKYDYILTIDADLQHLPEELPAFLENRRGVGICIGTRNMRDRHMPFLRRLGNNLTSIIISVFSGQRIRDSQSGYRMVSTEILRLLRVRSLKYDFESELLFQAGMLGVKVSEIPITTVYGNSPSYINPLKDTGRFIKTIWNRIWI